MATILSKSTARWCATASAPVLAAVISVLVTPTAAYAAGPYQLKNYRTLKCAGVSGASLANYAKVVQRTCNNDSDSQFWWFIKPPNHPGVEWIWIQNVNSLACMQAPYSDNADDAVYQYDCNVSTVRQRWYRVSMGNGVYLIKNYHTKRCLYVMQGSLLDGALIGTVACGTSYAHYRWYIN
ncbi:MAG: RICIN domain-containing protein [Micromonosporaceae bacterium]